MSEQSHRAVASDIEEAYAEIGRTVVESAIEQARAAGDSPADGIETTVTIRLQFEAGVGSRMPVACCVCIPGSGGVWVCAGPCCPA